jgi:hypothetical protein
MSVFRSNLAATCRKCGSSLTGRLAETVKRERDGQRIEVDVFRCRCGGGRRITRRVGTVET